MVQKTPSGLKAVRSNLANPGNWKPAAQEKPTASQRNGQYVQQLRQPLWLFITTKPIRYHMVD
jgi:hypothetical protein